MAFLERGRSAVSGLDRGDGVRYGSRPDAVSGDRHHRPPGFLFMAHSAGTSVAVSRGGSAHLLDYAIPAAMLLAVLVVLAPVPAPVVDLMLAANLTVSVLALLGALAARTPLEMSIFPTFLLGSTLVRIVLNIATTRLILTRAAVDGGAAAGGVVQAFGEFVAANDLVVGGVVFAIIAVIQFVVITAGSTRTSEVAARFALDGLPGRQMAIDTEVQAGTITREQAREMRLDLQRQADFFASMDGASRFVRGEAVAGVIITAVNLVGGLAIGVGRHGMPLPKAAGLFSRLTIGDGLASAVPSLFVSVAMGLLISRSSQAVDLSREFGRQFAARGHVLAITAVFLGVLCFTDLPPVPLAIMASLTAFAAWVVGRRRGARGGRGLAGGREACSKAEAGPAAAIVVDEAIIVELGRGLIGLVAGGGGARGGDDAVAPLVAGGAAVRERVAGDLGVLVPAILFRDDLSLPERGFRITLDGDVARDDELPAGAWFMLPPRGEVPDAAGGEATDPLTRRRGVWVGQAQAESARRAGAEVFDAAAMLVRHVEACVRAGADRLLTRDAVGRLVESLRGSQPAVVEQIIPGVISLARVHRTLQSLLRDGVPIRPLAKLLEIMADHADEARDPEALAEVVRRHVAAAICRRARGADGRLSVVRLEPGVAASLAAGVRRPSPQFVARLRRAVRPGSDRGAAPVLVVPAADRSRVRSVLARHLPDLRVLAEEDIADEQRVEVFATLADEEVSRAA
jgi:flagellar biosynthesis protein FlhA